MKTTILALFLLLGVANANAETGDHTNKVANQKRTELNAPSMKAIVVYEGGDTLYLAIDKEDLEKVHVKLLGGSITLLNDAMGKKQQLRRKYIISKLPIGQYKIQLKKGNYVVEKTFSKNTPASDPE